MNDSATVSGIQRLLERLGLHRPELRSLGNVRLG